MSALALHQIRHRVDHSTRGRSVGQFHGLADLPQTEPAHARAVRLLGADGAAHQRYLERLGISLRHGHPVISSTDLPRFAAISAGVVMRVKPLMVARTTL